MAEIFYRNIVKVTVAASNCVPYGRGECRYYDCEGVATGDNGPAM